jgi:serine/threonine protein kinase
MGNPTATLERENLSAMNAQAPQLDDPERPRADSPRVAAMKFTYPSGSRPLEGYTIKRGVGRGGFGEVYFATSDAGKEVALKLIRRNLEVELRGVTQCLNLKHPNLIALYDIKTDEMGDQWVIMEYVSGESLEDVIDRNPKGLPVEEALYWMRGLCAGVAYLHDHGIVHRDLKPGNIFSDEGTVKIGDYGLAKFISCSRRSGQTESVGTVHYMAPEIANGRYGREIDTYALGIILFEMLTGHVPFEGESVGEVLMKHLTAEPDLSVLQEPYYDIVKRALAKDPDVRLKNVGELVAMLPGSQSGSNFARMDAQTIPHAPSPPPAVSSTGRPKETSQATAREATFNAASRVREELHQAGQQVADHFGVEEPIAKAIRTGFGSFRQRWVGQDSQPLTGAQKVGLCVVLFFLFTWFTNGDAVNVAIRCAVVYAIYYAVWASLIRPSIRRHTGEAGLAPPIPPTPPLSPKPQQYAAQPAVDQTVAWPPTEKAANSSISRYEESQRRRRARTNWRDRAAAQLAAKPLREKLTELVGSMLLAALFSAIAACVVPLFSSSEVTSEVTATYFWLAVVGTLGSWAVMIPAKLIEGKLEDHVPMRIALMLLGALLGVAAWGVARGLMIHLPTWREPISIDRGLVSHEMLGWNISKDISPPAAVYIAYFAFIFLIPRWWRQAEFTRSTRMSIWRVAGCVFFAWLVHLFWWFPQPLGMAAAGVISLSTQLASPWMTPSQRRAISEMPEQAVTS